MTPEQYRQSKSRTGGASTFRSYIAVKIKKPARFLRRLNTWRSAVHRSLNLLALMLVIVIINVKIIIKKQ